MWIDEDEKIVHKGQRHNQKGRNKRFNPYQNVVSLMVSSEHYYWKVLKTKFLTEYKNLSLNF